MIVGGLVFQELTRPYLGAYGDWTRRAPPRLLVALDREGAVPDPEWPRIVLLASVLPDAANLGYQDLRDLIVRDGQRPAHRLARRPARGARPAPRAPTTWSNCCRGRAPRRVVIGVDEARAAAARLHDAYGVDRMDSAEAEPPAARPLPRPPHTEPSASGPPRACAVH